MMVYMNHFGPRFKKHQKAVMNCFVAAVRKGAKQDASAKRLDSNAQLFASVKENVKQANFK